MKELTGRDLFLAARRAAIRSTELRLRSAHVIEMSRIVVQQVQETGHVGAQRSKALVEEVAGLKRAMESRAVIEQAKGVIMARTGCDAARAFQLLVAQSQHENRKLRELASALVEGVAHPPATLRPHAPPGARAAEVAG